MPITPDTFHMRLCAVAPKRRGHDTRRRDWEIPATISTNKSGFRGVTLHQGTGKWFACIREFGKTKYLGLFKDPIVAARLYDEKARELFGDAAKTNFK